ncbi:uncharacterized protein A4U43_C08F2900 [Asparagus officinalis]|nr:uncharacterized protein A4U43_C08F2900 [Asparagus officinalis]
MRWLGQDWHLRSPVATSRRAQAVFVEGGSSIRLQSLGARCELAGQRGWRASVIARPRRRGARADARPGRWIQRYRAATVQSAAQPEAGGKRKKLGGLDAAVEDAEFEVEGSWSLLGLAGFGGRGGSACFWRSLWRFARWVFVEIVGLRVWDWGLVFRCELARAGEIGRYEESASMREGRF